MQSGKIKHWNQDKGYGFIDVDDQSEDVFFHISNVRLSQPISMGQRVYFNSERNGKGQLRATEVTSNSLSIIEDTKANASTHPNKLNQNNHHNTHKNNHKNSPNLNNRNRSNKKSPLSTLFSFIAIIAVAVYFFVDVPSLFLTDDLQSSATQSVNIEPNQTNKKSITGDAQIDNTIALIQQGGPYPYPNKDGTTFYNRESRLPAESSGYYREYTVPTPGISHRGARRIVTGGNPPTVYYLTLDHYDSFSQLEVN